MSKLENYTVRKTERREIAAFIEANHYSGSINGCIADYCFSLHDAIGVMCGAMFFGRMAMAGQWKRFAEREVDVIELRRLCCIDATPKNAESFFIGHCLRWLKKNTAHSIVVSYADAEYGHSGVIYKASNFTLEGRRPGANVIVWNGKRYHDKAIRTKYRGVLKPFAVRIKLALKTGAAVYAKTAGKFCYTYILRKTKAANTMTRQPPKLPLPNGDSSVACK